MTMRDVGGRIAGSSITQSSCRRFGDGRSLLSLGFGFPAHRRVRIRPVQGAAQSRGLDAELPRNTALRTLKRARRDAWHRDHQVSYRNSTGWSRYARCAVWPAQVEDEVVGLSAKNR